MSRLARIGRILKNSYYHRYRFINGTRGVISLFLAILMLPFTTIAGSLINAARVSSAVAIFDEALCNASNSTLGTYDKFLRQRFGLLALSQEVSGGELSQKEVAKMISDTFREYMRENLKTLSNTYVTSESESEGIYSLADPNVLTYQVLEYSKYSVPLKLVEDGLGLEDILGDLEDMIPGSSFFDFITEGAGTVDNVLSLAESTRKLKDTIDEAMTAQTNYTSAYSAFESSVSAYNAKKNEMDSALAAIQETIDNLNTKVSAAAAQISSLQQQITDLETPQEEDESDYSEQVSELQKQITKIQEDNEKDLKELQDAKEEYDNTKRNFGSELRTLQANAEQSRSAYVSKIGELSPKLEAVYNDLTAVQDNITSVSNSVVETTTKLGTGVLGEMKNDNKKRQGAMDDKANSSDNEDVKKEKARLKDEAAQLDNIKTVVDAREQAYTNGMQEMNDQIGEFDKSIYSTAVSKLNTLGSKIGSYKTDVISSGADGSSEFSSMEAVSRSAHYLEMQGLLTKEAVEKAEKEFVAQTVKASVWTVIKTIISFFEALFSLKTIYDQKLGAVIDMGYYDNTYHGLPSVKNKKRSEYPLFEGSHVNKDRERSQDFKELFGDFSAEESSLPSSFDLFQALGNIFNAFATITGGIGKLVSGIGFLELAKLLKEMFNAVTTIVNNISGIFVYLSSLFSNFAERLGSKILLAGYIHYMLSDRMTYDGGSALTGTSFNKRDQDPTSVLPSSEITDMLALITSIYKVVTGGNEKCFVGAEKEYVMFGSISEIVNQTAVFGCIYLVRLVSNLVPIFTNTEVQAIASAATIAYPIVMLIYVLAEPLIDTILMVNGTAMRLIKSKIYLTPSGIVDLVEALAGISLSTATAEELKGSFGKVDIPKDTSKKKNTGLDVGKYFTVDYSETLFLLMLVFTSPTTMIERLSDIIEMEAVENIANNTGLAASNGLYDLDYSYTYIRTEATFTMHEFFPITKEAIGFNKKRIVYKGY